MLLCIVARECLGFPKDIVCSGVSCVGKWKASVIGLSCVLCSAALSVYYWHVVICTDGVIGRVHDLSLAFSLLNT